MQCFFKKNLQRLTTTKVHMTPITSIINSLEWHPTKKWAKRTIDKIDTILVHQAGMVATVEGINKYHITPTSDQDNDGVIEGWERNHLSDTGAPHICYHFVIDRSGKVYQTNRITDVTWHAKGYNTKGIGILVNGNFDGPHWSGTEAPTAGQIRNLKRLLRILSKKYNIQVDNIKGHGEINPLKEACPGTLLLNIVQQFRDELCTN